MKQPLESRSANSYLPFFPYRSLFSTTSSSVKPPLLDLYVFKSSFSDNSHGFASANAAAICKQFCHVWISVNLVRFFGADHRGFSKKRTGVLMSVHGQPRRDDVECLRDGANFGACVIGDVTAYNMVHGSLRVWYIAVAYTCVES